MNVSRQIYSGTLLNFQPFLDRYTLYNIFPRKAEEAVAAVGKMGEVARAVGKLEDAAETAGKVEANLMMLWIPNSVNS